MAVVIFLVSGVLFYALTIRLISQVYYHQGAHQLKDGYSQAAVRSLEKAVRFNDDDPFFWLELGKAYAELSRLQTADQALVISQEAKNAYQKAADLDPFDPVAAYRLAKAEEHLQRLYPHVYPDGPSNPYNPLPFFHKALQLRPNAIQYHYSLALYLYAQGLKEALLETITTLARIYPEVYGRLTKAPFWSSEVQAAAKEGIQQAIVEGTGPDKAHRLLSRILLEQGDPAAALSHYQQASAQGVSDAPPHHYRLGELYLENHQVDDAEESFMAGLSLSENWAQDLNHIVSLYKKKGIAERLPLFHEQLDARFQLPDSVDIQLARAMIDGGRHADAQRILEALNGRRPSAEAYYWLARIAEKEADPGRAEVAIQKATVLDPREGQYHLTFSHILSRQGKLDRAEKEAGLAIQLADKPSPGMFQHRAQLRWRQQDYLGAARDWEQAISLAPKNPAYYAGAAEAYAQAKKWSLALSLYQQAMDLDPQHRGYQEKHALLKKRLVPDGN